MKAAPRTGMLAQMVQRSNYAYVNARVRVRKAKLLPPDTYPKLLKMEIPEITRFIESTEYGKEIDELAGKFGGIDLLENSLNVNEERNYAEVRRFAKGEAGDLVDRYLERFTNWNLKTILRGRFWGAKPEEIQRELLIENRADYDFWRGLIEAEGTGVDPVLEALGETPRGLELQRVLKEAKSKVTGDALLLQHLEDALDRAYFARLLATIPDSGTAYQLFLRFVKKEIDILNLSVLMRFEWRNDPTTRVLEFMIPGGLELAEDDLRRLAEANNRAELVDRLKEYRIYEEIKDAVAAAQESHSLTPVLLALTRSLVTFAQSFSYRNPLSILPVVNYLLRKHLEVRNLRAIARGKQAGLSEQQIENLLVVV